MFSPKSGRSHLCEHFWPVLVKWSVSKLVFTPLWAVLTCFGEMFSPKTGRSHLCEQFLHDWVSCLPSKPVVNSFYLFWWDVLTQNWSFISLWAVLPVLVRCSHSKLVVHTFVSSFYLFWWVVFTENWSFTTLWAVFTCLGEMFTPKSGRSHLCEQFLPVLVSCFHSKPVVNSFYLFWWDVLTEN